MGRNKIQKFNCPVRDIIWVETKIQTSPCTPSQGGQYAPIPLRRGQGEVAKFNYSINHTL